MTTDVMIFAILAVAVLLSAIAWSLFIQWRMQRRKLDESEREVADAISRHIKLLSAVAAVLESGRRPPRDLLCVFHRNRGMEPYVPFPCEWISHDVSEEAARWADRIEALLDGRALPHELGPNLILPDKGSTA